MYFQETPLSFIALGTNCQDIQFYTISPVKVEKYIFLFSEFSIYYYTFPWISAAAQLECESCCCGRMELKEKIQWGEVKFPFSPIQCTYLKYFVVLLAEQFEEPEVSGDLHLEEASALGEDDLRRSGETGVVQADPGELSRHGSRRIRCTAISA